MAFLPPRVWARPFARWLVAPSVAVRKVSTARPLPAEPRVPSVLSSLPTHALLRSLFINGIAAKPWLLTRALGFLARLGQPGRSVLFDVERNRPLARLMRATLYKQFCAGETEDETRHTMQTIKDMGFRGTILTYSKETIFDYRTHTPLGLGVGVKTDINETQPCPSIRAWREGTLQTVSMLREGDQLAVKVTGAGPLVTDALAAGELPPQQMLDALREVSDRCRAQGARVLIDAESQRYQAGIFRLGLLLMREYNGAGHALVYNTYQAYLKSTPATVARHLGEALGPGGGGGGGGGPTFTLGLKLVRGAYLDSEPRALIHDTKQATDDAYDTIARGALRQDLYGFGGEGAARRRPFPSLNLLLASHNKESVVAAHRLHQQRRRHGLPTVPVQFAQLQGMADEVSFSLLRPQGNRDASAAASPPEVYKCSTWGSLADCLAYLGRRALENRDAASRTESEYKALKAEAGRRLRALFSFAPGNQ